MCVAPGSGIAAPRSLAARRNLGCPQPRKGRPSISLGQPGQRSAKPPQAGADEADNRVIQCAVAARARCLLPQAQTSRGQRADLVLARDNLR